MIKSFRIHNAVEYCFTLSQFIRMIDSHEKSVTTHQTSLIIEFMARNFLIDIQASVLLENEKSTTNSNYFRISRKTLYNTYKSFIFQIVPCRIGLNQKLHINTKEFS